MARRGLEEYSSLFFILFLVFPKGIQLMAPKRHAYSNVVKRPTNAKIDVNALTRRTDWIINVMKDDEHVLKDASDEPGFDISDDEIVKFKLWRKGIIPYYIDTVSYSDKVLRDRIRLFLNSVNSLTKLRFVELPTPPEDDTTRYVFFANRRGQLDCFDHSILNFTNEGVQSVHLGYECLASGGEMAKAVLAIAGVPPQHNSPNRDDYITIVEENIKPEKKYLFTKLKNDEWIFDCETYDYQSASHFGHYEHSVNGKATIRIQEGKQIPDGDLIENNKFTLTDIMKLRLLYNYIVSEDKTKLQTCFKLFRKGAYFRDEDTEKDTKTRPRPPACPDKPAE